MGLCLGTELTEEKKARIRSAKIDRDLYEFAKMEMNVVKILLLGESAKVWRPQLRGSLWDLMITKMMKRFERVSIFLQVQQKVAKVLWSSR